MKDRVIFCEIKPEITRQEGRREVFRVNDRGSKNSSNSTVEHERSVNRERQFCSV